MSLVLLSVGVADLASSKVMAAAAGRVTTMSNIGLQSTTGPAAASPNLVVIPIGP